MKLKHSLLFIALLSTTAIAATTTPVGAELAGATKAQDSIIQAADANGCRFDIKFLTMPKIKKQTIDASPTVKLFLKQYLATQTRNGADIASNVMCQQLIGQQYTGSQQEWAGFIDNGIKGLLKAGVTDIQFTKVGDNDAAYKGPLGNIEYVFTGNNGGNKQVIHNLAVLDKANNQVITLSVSGNEKVTQEIQDEYKRLVNSFSL